MSSQLHLHLFGGFKAFDHQGRPVSIANKKLCGLIAYLALQDGESVDRSALAEQFWSAASPDKAGGSLRQCLRQMKSIFAAIDFDGFDIGRETVALDRDRVITDLDRALEDIRLSGKPGGAGPSLEPDGTVLFGFDTLDPEFEVWLQVKRTTWTNRLEEALERKLRDADSPEASHAAGAMLRLDPTHEGAHRAVIRRHADAGNTASALKQYDRLWTLLDEDYGMEPSAETQDLIVDIKSGAYRSALDVTEPSAGTSIVPIKTWTPPALLVSRFVQGGPSDGEIFLVDGFRRELIGALIRFREWRIHDWVRELPGPEDQRFGESPTYLLEGTYYSHDGVMRVVVTLKEFFSQQYVWSEQIELAIENWFKMQSDLVRKVSTALNVNISIERLSALGPNEVHGDLYTEWLRGQELTQKWRKSEHDQARQTFRGIIDRAPDFGRAYSSLAQIENALPLVEPGRLRTGESRSTSVSMARRAVTLDPLDTRAHLHLAWALAIDGQPRAAEVSFDAACSLNANDPWTLVSAALGWAFCGRADKAEALADQALALDLAPSQTHWGYRATLKFLCGKYEECLACLEQAGTALINLPAWRAATCHHLGDPAGAEAALEEFLDLVKGAWSADTPPDRENIAEWLVQCFPIADRTAEQSFRSGLIAAGLPAS